MSIEQFIKKIATIEQRLNSERPKEAELIGREALALIRRRIQNTGDDAQGKDLGNYSQTDVPAFFFFNRSVTAAGEAKVRKAAKQKQKISYADFREFNNRPTDFVNLTFTGAMWREMAAKVTSNTQTSTTVTITPTTPRSAKVLGFNITRYGDILALSQNELAQLREANRLRVLRVFRGVLNK
jgi:hypothetical protein